MTNVIADLAVRLTANMSDVNAKFTKLDTDLKTASSGFTAIGGDLTSLGTKLSIGLTAPLVAAGIAAFNFSTDFNAAMANVATLIPGNVDRVEELKTAVQNMAVEVGKSTGDLAGGLYQIISAFGDSADTAQLLEINAKAAAAGLATTTDAINLTSSVTKGYGDVTAEAAQKAADLAFQTVKLGQTTFPELAASIGRVVPIAATLGVTQEELFAGFATLTGVTGNASEVSTQLAGILRAMIKPTDDMSEAINSLGYESAQAMVQDLGLVGSLRALIGTTDGSQEAVGELVQRAEALTSIFALSGGQAETFDQKLAAMADTTGVATEAFREQTEGINATGFQWNQFKIRMTGVVEKLGDGLLPALSKLLDLLEPVVGWIGEMADKFGNLPTPIQTTVIAVVALAAAIGPMLIVAGQLVTAVGSIIPVLTKLIAVTGGGSAALMGIAKAVPVAAAAFAGWKLGEWLNSFTNEYKDAEEKVQALSDSLEAQGVVIERGGKSLKDWAAEVFKASEALDANKKSTEAAKEATKKAAEAAKKAAEEQKKFTEKQKVAVKTAAELEKEQKDLNEAYDKYQKYLKDAKRETALHQTEIWKLNRETIKAKDATALFYQGLIKVGDETVDYTAVAYRLRDSLTAIETAALDVKDMMPPFSQAISDAIGLSTPQVNKLGDAMKTLGLDSIASKQTIAEQMTAARDAVLGSGVATDFEKQTAIYRALKAQVDAAKEAGVDIPAEQQKLLDQLRTELEGDKGVSSLKKPWDSLKSQVSTIFTDLSKDLNDILWGEGGESIKSKFLGMFESMGQAVTRFVIEYLEGKLFSAFAKLLDDILPAIGKALGGLFGFGGGAAAAAGTAAGTAAGGAAAGAGGAAGTAVGAGISGTLGAVFGGISAATGVIGLFQNAKQETTLNAIEESTRRSALYLGDRADGGILGVLFSINEELAWGVGTKALERIRDEMVNLGAGYINPSLDTLKDNAAAIKSSLEALETVGLKVTPEADVRDIIPPDVFSDIDGHLTIISDEMKQLGAGYINPSLDSMKQALWDIIALLSGGIVISDSALSALEELSTPTIPEPIIPPLSPDPGLMGNITAAGLASNALAFREWTVEMLSSISSAITTPPELDITPLTSLLTSIGARLTEIWDRIGTLTDVLTFHAKALCAGILPRLDKLIFHTEALCADILPRLDVLNLQTEALYAGVVPRLDQIASQPRANITINVAVGGTSSTADDIANAIANSLRSQGLAS